MLDTKTLIKAVQKSQVEIINDILNKIKSGVFDNSSTITEAVSKIVAQFTQENDITNSISSNVRDDMQNTVKIWAQNNAVINADMVFNNYLYSYQKVINQAVSNIVDEQYSDIKDQFKDQNIIIGFNPALSLLFIFLIIAAIAYIIMKILG